MILYDRELPAFVNHDLLQNCNQLRNQIRDYLSKKSYKFYTYNEFTCDTEFLGDNVELMVPSSLEQVLQVFNMRRHGFIQVTLGTTLPLMVHQISALWQYFWPLNAGHTISPLAFNPAHQDAAWPCMGQHLSLCCEERQRDFDMLV